MYTARMVEKKTPQKASVIKKTTEKEHNQARPKTLYRSRTDTVIAGVAGGLGEYFALDPVLIRLLFVLATIFGGFGVPAYIVLWIILPEEPTGEIGSEETVKKNVSQLKNRAESLTQGFRGESTEGRSRSLIGAILIGLGVMFILDNFGFFRADIFWPLILVVVGIFILRRT